MFPNNVTDYKYVHFVIKLCTVVTWDLLLPTPHTNLSAAVVTLVALETFLILVCLLMLDESVALMKHCITVTTFLPCLNKRVLLSQMDT